MTSRLTEGGMAQEVLSKLKAGLETAVRAKTEFRGHSHGEDNLKQLQRGIVHSPCFE